MKEAGLDDTHLIGLYIFYNLIYALSSYPMGMMADRWGLKRVYLAGLGLFVLVYFGMAAGQESWAYLPLIFIYGLYAAATEGISKAWITNICAPENAATAIGTYTAFESIAALVASALAGLLWQLYGAAVTFMASGTVALAVILYLAVASRSPAGKRAI